MRRSAMFIVLALVLALMAACVESADDEADDTEDDSDATEETATAEPTDAATEEPTEEPDASPTATMDEEPEETETPEAEETATAEPEETATPEDDDGDGDGDGEEHTISVQDNFFEPEELEISAGDTVTWVNDGGLVHTSTLDPEIAREPENAVLPDGAETWDSGDLEPGDEFSVTLEVPGEYVYFCRPHEALGMVGTIVVNEE